VALSVNRYQPPIFRGHAIGCERCHGPGELHVRGQQVENGRDLTIVNPRHLEPALREAICEQCHVLADHRVDRPGRETFDFRPGLPTSAFFALFNRASSTGNKAVGHVEQMKASRCYRKSEGRLGCTSCHDPHQLPAPQERLDYFRGKCLDCHEQRGCTVPVPERRKQSPGDSCIDCHMPVSSSVDIVHIATTDHRILRSPGNQQVVSPASPHAGSPLRLLNDDGTSSAGIEALSRELGIALTFEGEGLPDSPQVRQLGYLALAYLDKALAERPNDVLVQRSRAKALALLRRHKEALQIEEMVVKSAPSYEQALDECVLNAIELGDHRTALPFAERSIAINPWSAGLRERLAYLRVQTHDYGGAVHEAREALRLNPFLSFARRFLIESLIHQDELKGAKQEFNTLLGLSPADRDSLGRWFSNLQSGSPR
jgi:Flp pilus assembly protein TadD